MLSANDCGLSEGLRRQRIPRPGVQAAWPYGSSCAGSPPIQCVSDSTGARERDQRADSPSASQFAGVSSPGVRSEEHTSELQSRRDLVCRLLLEKKKKKITKQYTITTYIHSTIQYI